ncbi:histidine-rich glycoprotein-like [Belonocnema kinseyi]|uniref:histidine-rich glycoprotein-like n=1 Tax=Belonocnema kinseyi TaxID=2817044 RepID=UPI00143DDCD0|nr:histidine-rich glycoprotein-like [Belonocnema kinseyi]
MRMKGHRGHLGRHGHHGHHGHHGPHHGPHHRPHHGSHQLPYDGHHGPHHKNHVKLNPHHFKPKHEMLKRLHKRDHQHHAWKIHCGRSASPIAHQVNVRNPGMMKHFAHHCKSVFCHFRKRSCENEIAHSRPVNHHHHRHKHGCRRAGDIGMARAIIVVNEGLEHPHNRRCSSLPPTVPLNNTDRDCQQL